MKKTFIAFTLSVAVVAIAAAQQRGAGPGRGNQPPPSAQQSAPIDLTGSWVSVVTEDWRWRMATPPKGDYQSLPLNQNARRAADAWDLAKDDAAGVQCKAFGAGYIMRQPGRIHITWQDENTLKMEFDAGTQTKLIHFAGAGQAAAAAASGPRTWQGYSVGEWARPGRNAVADARVSEAVPQGTVPGGGGGGLRGAPPRSASMFEGGSLKVTTTNFRDGYLRTNGVPYSENATLLEHFDRLPATSSGDLWLIVSQVIEDPANLTQPYYVSSQFKKEASGAKWNPTPCRTDPPATPKTK